MRIALLLSLLLATLTVSAAPLDRIAAIVNDRVILESELQLRLAQLRTADARVRSQVLDAMVDDELILQIAIERKIAIEPDELQQAIDYIKKQNNLDDAQLAKALADQGLTREALRADLLRHRAINQLVAPRVTVTEEDIRTRYDQLRDNHAVTSIDLAQLVFPIPDHATEQQQDAAREQAARAVARIRAGEDLASLTALGWVEPTALPATWEALVAGMQTGDVRGPIAGPAGLYVLRANAVKRTAPKPFAEMKAALADELRQQALARQTRNWLDDLRKRAYIEIKN